MQARTYNKISGWYIEVCYLVSEKSTENIDIKVLDSKNTKTQQVANIREELSMTQCEKILDYMRSNGSTTPLDALMEFGCMRLASRINDLKRQGIGITNTIEININRYGEKIRYSRYKLEENN